MVTYDYPQILFFENLDETQYRQLSNEVKEKQPRLELEFSIGVGLTIAGALIMGTSFLKTRLR